MNGLVEYIATSRNPMYYHVEKNPAQMSGRSRGFIPGGPGPDEEDFWSPSDSGRSKHSYRASYPQSNREMEEYADRANAYRPDGDFRSVPPGPFPTPAGTRPRRSSLRQPGLRRRNSTPPKRVHFSPADIVYEPFYPHDRQTIEEIMGMMEMEMAPPSAPLEPSHSVVVRQADAKRDYPVPVSPGSVAETVKSLQAELVGDAGRPRISRSKTIGHANEKIKGGNSSRRNNHDEKGPILNVESPLLPDGRPVPREAQPTRRYTTSHYETEARRPAFARTESYIRPRPRGHTIPPVRSNRSSLASEATLVNAEQGWAPAKVVLKSPEVRRSGDIDTNKPVYVPRDGNALRRSDAQRIHPVPSRQRLLQNLSGKWF